MNALRRKQITEVINRISYIEELVGEVIEMANEIRDAEEEAYDNLPESLQESERGEAMQEAYENIENAMCDLDGIDFSSIYEYLEEAQA